MDLNLIITLISGLIGGNAAGAVSKENSLGAIGNSLAGLVGGGAGNWILQALGILGSTALASSGTTTGTDTLDITNIIGSIAGGGVGGAALTLIAGMIKNAIAK